MNKTGSLAICELYESIQGETSLSGIPTSFIRLAGCPLRCHWCDSDFTYTSATQLSFKEIFKTLQQFGWPHVCVTGGEPLFQTATIPFLQELSQKHYVISLETNGAFPIKEIPPSIKIILDIKCPKSGMTEHNFWENLSIIQPKDEIKCVIADRTDYEWAIDVIQKHQLIEKKIPILFSTVWEQLDPKILTEWIIADKLNVRLNIQIHKYIWHPTTRGV